MKTNSTICFPCDLEFTNVKFKLEVYVDDEILYIININGTGYIEKGKIIVISHNKNPNLVRINNIPTKVIVRFSHLPYHYFMHTCYHKLVEINKIDNKLVLKND